LNLVSWVWLIPPHILLDDASNIDLANRLTNLIQVNVNIHEAKTHLSRLIQEAIHGEEIVISKGKQPVARLVPIESAVPERRLGGAKGIIQQMAPDFNDEISDFEDEV
jgi:prevent-host-death family protein